MTPTPLVNPRPLPRPDADLPSDAQLLARFVGERYEPAFAGLVRRHAGLVYGVCRRALPNPADADDAFQAVFLVLLRRADGLTVRASLADWLHAVAVRVALKARTASARRLRRERVVAGRRPEATTPEPVDSLDWFDRELAALPERYREPVLLCLVQERSREEAAAALGIPEGTLASRLAYAKKRLADRLARQGVTLPVALAATVPAALRDATAAQVRGPIPDTVHHLATGAMRAMLFTKLRTGAAVLAGVLLTLGVGLTGVRFAQPATQAAPVPAKDGKKPDDRKLLVGTWVTKAVSFDPPFPVPPGAKQEHAHHTLTFTADDLTWVSYTPSDPKTRSEQTKSFVLDQTAAPKVLTSGDMDCIYELDGDTLKVAMYALAAGRPKGFTAKDSPPPKGGHVWLIELTRVKEEKADEPKAKPPEKKDEPGWMAKFTTAYQLKDGEYVKRVAPPFVPERDEYMYGVWNKEKQTPEREERERTHLEKSRLFFVLYMVDDGKELTRRTCVSHSPLHVEPRLRNGDNTMTVRDTVFWVTGLSSPRVAVHPDSQDHPLFSTAERLVNSASYTGWPSVSGDFVVRKGAPLDKLVPQLEKILRDECEVDVRLTLTEEEQDVYVVGGAIRITPPEWRDPKQKLFDVYATEDGLNKEFDPANPFDKTVKRDAVSSQRYGGTPSDFVAHLGRRVNRVTEWEKGEPAQPRLEWVDHKLRKPTAEDNDPEKVLANVSAQTGLTFKKEKRKVQVLVFSVPEKK